MEINDNQSETNQVRKKYDDIFLEFSAEEYKKGSYPMPEGFAGMIFQSKVEDELHDPNSRLFQLIDGSLKRQGISYDDILTEGDPTVLAASLYLCGMKKFSVDGIVVSNGVVPEIRALIEIKLGHFNISQINHAKDDLSFYAEETKRVEVSSNSPMIIIMARESGQQLEKVRKAKKVKEKNLWLFYSEISKEEVLAEARTYFPQNLL